MEFVKCSRGRIPTRKRRKRELFLCPHEFLKILGMPHDVDQAIVGYIRATCFSGYERRDVRDIITVSFLVLATTLEAGGDAIIRIGLKPHTISVPLLLMLGGAVTLYGYGLILNLAPLDWGRLIGAYVATFFVVGQTINLVVFRTTPTLPIVVGGLFILAGGAIITLWQR